MKSKFAYISLFLFFVLTPTTPTNAQQTTFSKKFGHLPFSYIFMAKTTPDKGILFTGSYFDSSGTGFVCVAKLDSASNIVWGSGFDSKKIAPYTAENLSNGHFIIAGDGKYYPLSGYNAANITELDNNGGIVWSKKYNDSARDSRITSISQCKGTTEFIAYGMRSDYHVSPFIEEPFFLKTDSTGRMLWAKKYNIPGSRGQGVMHVAKDGGFILLASQVPGAILLKTDTAGQVLWTKQFCSHHLGVANDFIEEQDGSFLITGDGGLYGTCLIKTDSLGNVLWTKCYQDNMGCTGWALNKTSDGGYVITGLTENFNGVGTGLGCYLAKVDSAGDLQWVANPGGIGPGFWPSFVMQAYNGGYYITAKLGNDPESYLIKTDSLGHLWNCGDLPLTSTFSIETCDDTVLTTIMTPIEFEVSNQPLTSVSAGSFTEICQPLAIADLDINKITFSASPNPFTATLTVTHPSAKGSIFITDITGKEVYRTTFTNSTGQQLQLAWLQPGMYFLTVTTNGVGSTKKIIKL